MRARGVVVLVDDRHRADDEPRVAVAAGARASGRPSPGWRSRRASARRPPRRRRSSGAATTCRRAAARDGRTGSYASAVARRRGGRARRRSPTRRPRAAARRSPTSLGSRVSERAVSRPSRSSQAPAASPRKARPPDSASSAAIWPAISTGCVVNGLSADGPTRTRSVARGDLEQRRQRGLEEQVVEDGDDVEARRPRRVARARRRRRGACRPGARARAPRSRQLVGGDAAPCDALDAHDHALVGIGAGDEVVLLEPVAVRELALLRGQERQDGAAARRGRSACPPGCARGSTRSPRSSRRPRGRRPSGPRSARRSHAGRTPRSRPPTEHTGRAR